MRLVQGMYANVRSCVRVGERYSEEFEVKVGVHQGSVLGFSKMSVAMSTPCYLAQVTTSRVSPWYML